MTRLTRLSYSSRAPSNDGRSVLVGDRQLVGGEQRDDLRPARGDDHFLLDARGRGAVRGGGAGVRPEHHPPPQVRRAGAGGQAAEEWTPLRGQTEGRVGDE